MKTKWHQFYLLCICMMAFFLFPLESAAGVLNDYNPWQIDIPDDGSSVNSDLDLSGAPSGDIINNLKVYYEIRHTNPGNLDVWLTTYYDGSWHDYFLYHQGDLDSTDDIIETRDNIHAFDGASPNQTWYLVVRDNVSGDVGYIDFFELWITHASESEPIIDAQITDITFNQTEVERGKEVIIADITIMNTGNESWDFYVGGSSLADGGETWYDWLPSRIGTNLGPGQTGTISLSWSPPAYSEKGSFGFYTKIFKYSSGDEFLDENWLDAAFDVIDAQLSLSGKIAYHTYSEYLSEPQDSIDGNVFIYDLNSKALTNVTGSLPVQNSMNPHFSSDGSKITFMAIPDDAPRGYDYLEVYLYDLAKNQLARLTQNSMADEDPKFGPQGNSIVFKRYGQIWTMNADGTNLQQITNTADEKSGPSYSPDGGKIAYWSESGPAADIWWMDSNGDNPLSLINISGLGEYYPVFRDSNRILYTRWESLSEQAEEIYQYSIDTAQSESLPINLAGVDDSDPFAVNSAFIGFSSNRYGGKGGWDIYIGESQQPTYYVIDEISSPHNDCGGSYTQFNKARRLEILAPANDANLEQGTSQLIRVQAYSDGGIWSGANLSVTLSGPETQTFTGFNDDGTGADQVASDGIYSMNVGLPSAVGTYTMTATAVSLDNGLQNDIVSEKIDITLFRRIGSLKVDILPQAAIDAGAQWRVVSGSWQNSGETLTDLSVGQHTVEFSSIDNYDTPASQDVTINEGQLTELSIQYSETNPDSDNDGLLDEWELQYGELSALNGRNADDDGDGISNWVEYKLGTNPLSANAKAPGIYYQYDKLGRIQKIERIPSR